MWLTVWFALIFLASSAAQEADFSDRTYALYVPESVTDATPAPLLVVLHGAGGSGSRTQGWLGFDALADDYGFIVVYPDGLANNWDFGAGLPARGSPVRVDDVGFLVWLVEKLADEYPVDRQRVFVTGMSNGALMAYRLVCSAPETFKAAAGVAAPLFVASARDCVRTPQPILMMHGTADRILPWEQRRLSSGAVVSLSVLESFSFWARRNGCDLYSLQTEELPDTDPDDGSTVEHLAFYDCEQGTEVHLYGIKGGGHTWPGRLFTIDLELGILNRDIDASAVIMDWFAHLEFPGDSEQQP